MPKHGHTETDLGPIISKINATLESSDIHSICAAMGDAIISRGVSDVARKAGLERPSLYRAFKDQKRQPNFSTVLSVLDAVGLQLKVVRSKRDQHWRRPASNADDLGLVGHVKEEP